ncbi:uncharacterized protein LOC134933980 [Pseudophryne corroboree]|uniref:uncharacterized protein LOC134933980 n=1 Tax=Pseudophryne corroboree TaxID=495146 RepID=UPI00308185C6
MLDTGSQITTIQLSTLRRHWGEEQLLSPPPTWLQLIASNGLEISCAGYWEADIKIGATLLPKQGCLVTTTSEEKVAPIILGMNVLQRCPDELVATLRSKLTQAVPSSQQVLQKTIKILQGHQRFVQKTGEIGKVRLTDGKAVKLQPNSETILWGKARCGPGGCKYEALIESGLLSARQEVIVASSLVTVENGRVPVRVLNPHNHVVKLYRNQPLATLLWTTFQDVVHPMSPAKQCNAKVEEDTGEDQGAMWWDEIHIGDAGTPDEHRQGVLQVVRENMDAFSKSPTELGIVENIQHQIPTGDARPIKERHRPVAPGLYQPVRQMLEDMRSNGVIRESHSPWAAPMVLVKKKDGQLRFCVDYRKLNSVTHRDAYPLPRIEESLTALKAAKYFSTLDLTSGYWQVQMAEADKEKTAFVTPMGLYEFNRMPFGLCNAPATFQRVMEHCLGHRNFEIVLLYLDDIIIFSRTYPEHLQHLREVFQQLAKYGLKLKPSKCHLLKPEVQYLGHIVNAEGVSPDPDKIKAVLEWPVPRTVKDVRRFLGFVGYYRRFIQDFAKVATPLTELLRGIPKDGYNRKVLVEWSETRQSSFDYLKKALTEAPLLAYPDYSIPFRLYTDASKQGLGAVLAQVQEGQERVVAYASRSLRKTERNDANYSAFKLEFLALVWAVTEKFRDYLAATPFVAVTDCNPMAHQDTARLGALEQRWASRLANYRYKIEYRSGRSNTNADALSRLPVPDEEEEEIDPREQVEIPTFGSHLQTPIQHLMNMRDAEETEVAVGNEWIRWQQTCPHIRQVKAYLMAKREPSRAERDTAPLEFLQLWRQRDKLKMRGELLYKRYTDPKTHLVSEQILIPRTAISVVLQAYHNRSGHFGSKKTEANLRSRFYWHNLRQDTEEWCKSCVTCAARRPTTAAEKALLHPIVSRSPLELVFLDHVKMEPSRTGYTHVLTIVDHYTKFAVALPVRDLTARTTAEIFWRAFVRPYGFPQKILSDQGPSFESQLFKELCALYGCDKLRTTPYHPQGNGACERLNQTLIHMLRAFPPAQRSEWPTLLAELTFIYNHTCHTSTGYSPYYLLFGRPGKLPADLQLHLPDTETQVQLQTPWVREHQRRLHEASILVDQRLKAMHERQRRDYDRNAQACPLPVGSIVFKKNNRPQSKLDSKWELSPYVITEEPLSTMAVYQITRQDGTRPQWVHRNQIKPYSSQDKEPEEVLTDDRDKRLYIANKPLPQLPTNPLELLMNVSWPTMPSQVQPCLPDIVQVPIVQVEVPPDSELRRSTRSTRGTLPHRYQDYGDANKPQCTTFTEFKNKLKSMFRLYTLNEQQKVEILVGQLTGSALREVISWPTENKKEVDQILKRLSTTFETKTLPELKMKLYARKQQPGETLRDYALSLQETLRAIQAVDKDEVRNADEALTVQFIEGASRESVKTQLRLLKMQMPGKTFLDFKEAAITITGNQSGREEEYPELVDFRESSELMGATASSPERPKRVRDPVVQSSQHPSGDQIQTLRKQMEELTELRPDRTFKLQHPEGEGRTSGRTSGVDPDPEQWRPQYIGQCPTLPVVINGVETLAMLDTGSQITTIQLSTLRRHWGEEQLLSPPPTWLQLIASNGLEISCAGYWEADIKIGATLLPKQGCLVTTTSEEKVAPIILGMNVLQRCPDELVATLRSKLTQAVPSSQQVLQKTIKILQGHQRFVQKTGEIGKVRLTDGKAVKLQPNSETILWGKARCGPGGCKYEALIESGLLSARQEVIVASSLVTVENGRVPVRVLNPHNHVVKLYRNQPLATLLWTTFQDVVHPMSPAKQCNAKVEEDTGEDQGAMWWDEIHIGDAGTPDEHRQGVLQVVRENMDAFSKSPTELGIVENIQHQIPTGDARPIKERHRPVAPGLYQPVRQMLEDMRSNGVIRESHSPWAAPMVLVKKKDGQLRFCVDYRKLNSVTHRDAYPLPRIEESLTALKAAKYFSTLDLTSGYWQVQMAEADKEKTAFVTPMGLYEFNRMPFGLCNAPATFQRVMEHCLGHRNFEIVLLYLDDIIIFSRTYPEHLQHLREVFQQLAKYGLKLKPSKCHLLKPEVQYLGHIVNAEGVSPDPDKIKAVLEWPVPRTVKDVRRFLGFVGYYRRFIQDFAKVATPLTELLRGIPKDGYNRKVLVEWSETRQSSFDYLKKALTEAPLLAYPDYSIPFRLYTDASKQGLGAVLAQVQEGQERVVAYASRSLRKTERNDANYSAFKLEFLALVWAVTEKFRDYLAATPFVAVTDCNPMAHQDTARLGALEQRWASRLANYRYKIEYRSGRSNTNADALSRLPVPDEEEEEIDPREQVEIPTFGSHLQTPIQHLMNMRDAEETEVAVGNEWIRWQQTCPHIRQVKAYLMAKREPSRAERDTAPLEFLQLWRQRDKLKMRGELLYKRYTDPKTHLVSEQILIPRTAISVVLQAYHNRSGHFGSKKTEANLRSRFYWHNLRQDTEEWCKSCVTCAARRPTTAAEKALLHPIVSRSPLELVSLDHVKMEPSRTGYTHVLTIVDHYTKFAVALPVRDLTARTTAEIFWRAFVRPYGFPQKILSDQGPSFESQLFKELCALYGCDKLRTTPYHPQGNGACERLNQTLIHMLRAFPPAQRSEWPTLLAELTFIYNHTCHTSTGYSPYYLLFGRPGKLPADLQLHLPDTETQVQLQTPWVREHQRRLHEASILVDQRLKAMHERQRRDYDRNAQACPLPVGSIVFKKNNRPQSKLDSKWELSPYVITEEPLSTMAVYQITRQDGTRPQWVHRNQIKPYSSQDKEPEEVLTDDRDKRLYIANKPLPQLPTNPLELLMNVSWPTMPSQVQPCLPDIVQVPIVQVEVPPDSELRRSTRSTRGTLPHRYQD